MSRTLQWAAVQTASCCVLATSAALVATAARADSPSPQSETAPAEVPAAAPAAASLPELTEVIVTARRRGENLEKVPVSITALDSESLGKRTIQTEQDLQIAVPGLVVRPTEESNNLSFSIRGQGVDAQSGSRPGVLPYIDDIQVNTSTASSFFDLASVQVLKGPQGTLFGRNATGGAVLYTTAKPTNDLSGYATIRGGNFGEAQFQGAISVPIVEDKVLLRIAGNAEDQHGYVNNLYNGTRLGNIESRAVRATLLIRPIDKLENTTVFHYEVDNGTNIGPQIYSAYACGSSNGSIPLATATNCLFSPALDSLVGVPGLWDAYLATHPKVPAGGIAAYVDQQRAQGPYQVQFDNETSHRSHNYYLANTTTYEINSDLQFKNIFGLTSAVARDNTDLDGTPYGLLEVRDVNRNPSASLNDTRQLSEEFQLLGKALDQHLNYIVGFYYGYERDIQLLPVNVLDLAPILPSTLNVVGATLKDNTEALFTQGTYDLSDLTQIHGLSFTAGVRYTLERNEIAQDPSSHFYGAPDEKQDTHQPSWQVGLEYQVTPGLLTYVETRGSFRSGGFNVVAPATFATGDLGGNEFNPEKTHDVEVGAKYQGALLGIPGRLNLAVYNQWVEHVQRAIYTNLPPTNTIASVTANVPAAEIRGVEGDGMLAPNSWLELGANFAYTNAAYTDGTVNLFGSQYTFGPYADAPRWSGSVYGQVTVPIPNDLGEASFRADVYSQSMEFFSNLNATVSPETSIPGYTIANLRLDWHDFFVKGLTVSAYGKNIADKRFYVGGIALGAGLGINGVIPGAPRMYGGELSYKF